MPDCPFNLTPEYMRARVQEANDRWWHRWPGETARQEAREARRNATRKEQPMAYETRDNTGTLFRNDRKTTDSHPNAKGKALIAGVWYWVSAWTKEPRQGGDKFQSLSFEEMTEEQVAKYGGGQAPAQAPRQQQRPAQRQAPVGSAGVRRGPEEPFGEAAEFTEDDLPF